MSQCCVHATIQPGVSLGVNAGQINTVRIIRGMYLGADLVRPGGGVTLGSMLQLAASPVALCCTVSGVGTGACCRIAAAAPLLAVESWAPAALATLLAGSHTAVPLMAAQAAASASMAMALFFGPERAGALAVVAATGVWLPGSAETAGAEGVPVRMTLAGAV